MILPVPVLALTACFFLPTSPGPSLAPQPASPAPAVTFVVAQTPVHLGKAGHSAILAKAGISTTGTTQIVGDIGVSPISFIGLTGFGLTSAASNRHSTSSLVQGPVYAPEYAPPTPAYLTVAVSDMEVA